jgi:Kef-type K+ transport system membrane component KefB
VPSSATETSVVLVVAAVAAAPILADSLQRWIAVPNVVVELMLGILIGPAALGLVTDTPVIAGIADFGLAMLMFLAGYEIDFHEISGTPLRLALSGWPISLVLGLAAGTVIRGVSLGGLVLGLALTTTALGSILPILGDAGILGTRFGGQIMAIGAIGEFGPVVAVALLLTSDEPLRTSLLLAAFAVITAAAGLLAIRRSRHPLLTRLVTATLDSSGQLAIRLSMLTIAVMLWITASFGLDVLLGAFAAGVIEHLATQNANPHDREAVRSKLDAIGFGFVVPFFFVISGVKLDVTALVHQPSALAFIPVFLLLFLLVRGGPVPFLYRNVATRDQVAALALLSATALPLVVVITTIGTQAGVIRASTAAALVCAGMLSVLILPLTALKILRRETAQGTSPGSGDSSEPPGSYASEEKRTQVDSRRAPGHSRRPLESSLPAPT